MLACSLYSITCWFHCTCHYNEHRSILSSFQSLGQVGRVVMLDEDGYPILKVNGYQWVMDCCCLQLVPGEKPENEMSMSTGRAN